MAPLPFRRLLPALAGLTLALAACQRPSPSAGSLVLVDDAGDTTRLARPAVRVASLVPATTELLFALGAGTSVVGRTKWCDWPAEARAVTDLGDGIPPNLEAVVGVRPDLVVLYRSARNALTAGRLRALGIPVVQLRTDSFEDLKRNAALLGRATGHEAGAARVAAELDTGLAAASRPDRPRPPRVLILGWDQPPMVIGRGSFLHELVVLAGGRNAFGDLPGPDAPVSLEAIAARNPDLILTSSDAPGFASRPEWQVIPAVRDRRFVPIRGSEFSRPSPRAPAAVRSLAAAFDSLGRR